MKENFNWIQLINKKEENIKVALLECYKKACGKKTGSFKCDNSAILYNDGDINFSYTTKNTESGAVWRGEAIYLGTIEEFVPWEYDDEYENWIKFSLNEEERNNFINFINETFYDLKNYKSFDMLKEWDEEVYNRITDEAIEIAIEENGHNWVDMKFDELLKEYEEKY